MSTNFSTTPVCGSQLYETSTEQKFDLGTSLLGTNNTKWLYVKSSVTIPQYAALAISDAFDAILLTTANAPQAESFAVTQTAFAGTVSVPEYGWVCQNGTGNVSVLALASAAADVKLYATATPGYVDDAGTQEIQGIKLVVANGGSNAAVACAMNSPQIII